MRRRGKELDQAIRQAVLDLIATQGPQAVTMEAVAAAAGTGKAVLYRRWPDRTALLRDVLLGVTTAGIPAPDTGSARADLTAVLNGWAELMTGPTGPGIRAVVSAMSHDPGLAAAFREGVIAWRKDEMGALLQRGIERGELRADLRTDVARELGQSVLWHRLLVTGDPIDEGLVRHLVDEVLWPYIRS